MNKRLRTYESHIFELRISDPRSNAHYLSSSENKAWTTTAQIVYITARITFIHVFIRS